MRAVHVNGDKCPSPKPTVSEINDIYTANPENFQRFHSPSQDHRCPACRSDLRQPHRERTRVDRFSDDSDSDNDSHSGQEGTPTIHSLKSLSFLLTSIYCTYMYVLAAQLAYCSIRRRQIAGAHHESHAVQGEDVTQAPVATDEVTAIEGTQPQLDGPTTTAPQEATSVVQEEAAPDESGKDTTANPKPYQDCNKYLNFRSRGHAQPMCNGRPTQSYNH